jgi:Xaa-Pro aminopeptidase
VEPGYYREGEWGIRTESVVLCKELEVGWIGSRHNLRPQLVFRFSADPRQLVVAQTMTGVRPMRACWSLTLIGRSSPRKGPRSG